MGWRVRGCTGAGMGMSFCGSRSSRRSTACVPLKHVFFRLTLTFHTERKKKRLQDVVFAPCVDVRSLKSLRTIPIPIRKSSLPCESTWSWCERWPPVRRHHHQPAVTCPVPLIAPSSVSTALANNEADNLDECPRLKDVVHREAELWYIHSTLCQVHDVPELSIRCPNVGGTII